MEAWEYFQKGGPVMYLLLLCSIAVAVIGIERYRFYRYAEKDSDGFMKSLSEWLKDRTLEQSLAAFREQNSTLGYLAAAGTEAAVKGDDVGLAIDTAYGEIAMQLRARLNYLSMIVTLAPLLGLLGTISGMIESFSIFNLQAGQPLAITGGIGEALVATATGLCVAIFALVVHTYFAQRLDEELSILDKTSAIVLNGLRGKGEEHEA